ncbi:MAG: BRO family protein [Polyangiaceae bacterium]
MSALAKVFHFEARPVRVFLFNGRPCWIAQEIGDALGYTPAGWRKALSDWADELIDGKDSAVLRGQQLREFKSLSGSVDSTLAKTTNLTVLFETGVHVVALKTDKPLGKKLRRWLADEVMPGLLRGTLDKTAAEKELVALSLRLTAGDASTIWEIDTVQEMCRLWRWPVWTGAGRMDPRLRRPMGLIYRIVLGDVVYEQLKARNPDPRDGSLNYQFLTEARHKLIRNDMGTVLVLLRQCNTAREFYSRLRFQYRRAAMQTGWF